MAAPHLDDETRALVAQQVLTAQKTLPQLVVTVTPHTRGRAWLVDTCCSRIWLCQHLPRTAMLAGLRDALRVLHQRRLLATTVPRQRCASPVLTG